MPDAARTWKSAALDIIGGMSRVEARATMWQQGDRWTGRLETPVPATVEASTRAACLAELRRAAGPDATLTVELLPALAGVAEAAAIMGWDKRRVITYLNRRRFPEPFAALASGRVWRREDVESFAESWRRRRGRKGDR